MKHYYRNVENLVKKIHKQLKDSAVYEKDKREKSKMRAKRSILLSDFKAPPELVNIEPQYLPYTRKETLYIEMFVSCDHRMLPNYNNNHNLLIERVLNAFAQVDKAYQAINVRIVVVAIDIQENVPAFTHFPTGGAEIRSFREYVNNVIRITSPFKDVDFDNAMFLSHQGWSDAAGMAWLNSMCGGNSNSINDWDYDSISGPTVILGHELGHNMGFDHDDDCAKPWKCLTTRGCFMGGSKSSRPGFSDCSMKVFKANEYSCLYDYPSAPLTKVCGNGIREGDEQCDCGTLESCANKGDNCCEPNNCVLKANAQCSHITNPECCQPSCLYKRQGTLCRKATDECDLAEYCEGDKATCPEDKVVANGASCRNPLKFFLGPTGDSSSVVSKLSPPLTTQYLKVLPKQWGVGVDACFKLNVHGCFEQDYISQTTSITSADLYYHAPFCIAPKIASCLDNVPDGTVLKYIDKKYHSGHCEHDYMKFVFTIDGTLKHKCSNKNVCIDSVENLVLRDDCNGETPKFSFTKERSLQHKHSKKCVLCTASGGSWPEHDCTAGVEDACDLHTQRSIIIMNVLDCDVPLMVQLPVSAYTASSVYSEKYIPPNVITSSNGWCPKVNADSWFHINFGKKVRIATVEMQETQYDRTTGYNIQYSDDGLSWFDYLESDADELKKSKRLCFSGKCQLTLAEQCRTLWESDTLVASDSCWNNLNTIKNGYGTCQSNQNTSCELSNVKCGQLQCNAKQLTPLRKPDYGKYYQQLVIDDQKCSGASITESAQGSFGMVLDGTICAENKFCVNSKCKCSEEHGFKVCPKVNGKECSGNGVCALGGTCVCSDGYSQADNCLTKLNPIDGKWSEWSDYTKCSKGCNGGVQNRHRFCSNPIARYGGKECDGDTVMERPCNESPCPVAESCLDIKELLESQGLPLYDGQYTVKPIGVPQLEVFCDMTRNGGGWTLIVSSHSNTWNEANVWERNVDKPDLYNDYSIFKYANQLSKGTYKNKENYYRLEANALGRWGGVFSMPLSYDLSSTNNKQTNVKILEKFDDWKFGSSSIGQRVPYVSKYFITTSLSVTSSVWGSLTDKKMGLHPSKWIEGDLKMEYPEHVWYWVRKGETTLPVSCLDIYFRSLSRSNQYKSGIYEIEPVPKTIVKTYCDFDRYGGGWTLLSNIVTRDWDLEKIKSLPSTEILEKDFSTAGLLEKMKLRDLSEKSYQIMIEANDQSSNGGIFSIPVEYDSYSCSKSYKPTLLKKFGTWDESIENIAKYPLCLSIKNGFVMSTNSFNDGDNYGIIAGNGKYMTNLENPSFIRIWIREGGSRYSCNDLRVRGLVNGQTYSDGFYMIADNQPVYCDMTSTANEAWTLLVTSTSGGWTPDQVYSRNAGSPSLIENFSILGKANSIKKLSNSGKMKYKLEGETRGRYGGIWEASTDYSFSSSSCQETEIISQFDSWDSASWWVGPYPCLPYFSSSDNGLLITSTTDNGGVIISKNPNHLPVRWIIYTNEYPGVVWYWLNENDCDSTYKPINGGVSNWSQWTSCSAFCGNGKQTRQRACSNPLPRCGGNDCSAFDLYQEQDCVGSCFTTQIRSSENKFCVEPETGICQVADNTVLVLRPSSSHCQSDASKFVFNPKTGSLLHKCSNKFVCSKDGIKQGSNLVVSSACVESSISSKIQRTMWNTLQMDNLCFEPNRDLRDGENIVLWDVCSERIFFMPELAAGSVSVSFFDNVKSMEALKTDTRYLSNNPTTSGSTDNFDYPPFYTTSGIRMQVYFKAPESGVYFFFISCDDMCELLFSKDVSVSNSAAKIASCSRWSDRYVWDEYKEQKSSPVILSVGMKYYLEFNLVNSGGYGTGAVAVLLPSGVFVAPISYDYFSAKSD